MEKKPERRVSSEKSPLLVKNYGTADVKVEVEREVKRSLVAHSLVHRQRDSEADQMTVASSRRVRQAIDASLIINVVSRYRYLLFES
jgi:hypothetical protein